MDMSEILKRLRNMFEKGISVEEIAAWLATLLKLNGASQVLNELVRDGTIDQEKANNVLEMFTRRTAAENVAAATAGVTTGGATAVGMVSAAGAVSGLSAAGITSGLSALGGLIGGGMAAGLLVVSGGAFAAGAIGFVAVKKCFSFFRAKKQREDEGEKGVGV